MATSNINASTILNRKRGGIKGQITRIKNIFDSDVPPLEASELMVKLAAVQKLQVKTDELRNEGYSVIDDNDLVEFEESLKVLDDDIESLEVRIQSLLSSKSELIVPSSSVASDTKIKLPPICLPQFSGQYVEWLNFKSQFVTLIDLNTQLSDSQKLYYLQSSLIGNAKQLQSVDDTYRSLFDALVSRYENTRLIVNEHINQLLNLNKLKGESSKGLRELMDNVLMNLRALKQLDLDTNPLCEAMLINIVLKCVDDETRKQFKMTLDCNELPSWKTFIEFLSKRSQALADVQNSHTTPKTKGDPYSKNSFVVQTESNKFNCAMCGQAHSIYKCKGFLDLSPRERQSEAKRLRLCYNCLSPNHQKPKCKNINKTCRTCNMNHHSLLHFERTPVSAEGGAGQFQNVAQQREGGGRSDSSDSTLAEICENKESKQMFACSQSHSGKNVILSTAIIYIQSRSGELIPCVCLLDSASQCSLITSELADLAGLKGRSIESSISGIGNSVLRVQKSVVVNISNKNGCFHKKIDALVVSKISADKIPMKQLDVSRISFPRNITYANPKFFEPTRIQMLLGGDVFFELMGSEQIRLDGESIILHNTAFGFIVTGTLGIEDSQKLSCHLIKHDLDSDQIEVSLRNFWELEAIGIKDSPKRNEEDESLRIFEKTVCFRDGRYEVSLPFKRPREDLADNFRVAEKRLKSLTKRFERNPSLLVQYQEILTDYLRQGIIERVQETAENLHSPVYYMPHQAVIREESVTTKTRIVFDASSHEDDQLSLNDCLWPGINLNPNIFHLLIYFRLNKVAFIADITKAFLQISLAPIDRNAVRFLFMENNSLQIFRFNRVLFGVNASPFLLSATIKEHIKKYKEMYPVAYQMLDNCLYVDDLVSGGDTVAEALSLSQDAKAILQDAKMNLRKFASNEPQLMKKWKENGFDLHPHHSEVSFGDSDVKVLGLQWNLETDTFIIDMKGLLDFLKQEKATKRFVLQTSGRIYDPLGFLSPFTIRIKCLFQALWACKLSWDEVLPPNLCQLWTQWCSQLPKLSELKIPRHILNESENTEIHIFADASIKAYGAVAYLRIKSEDRNHTNLIASKSRVAPLKDLSLPRLELLGALLAARLAREIKPVVEKKGPAQCYFWTDSLITLYWIKGPSKKWKSFVENRVREIQVLSDPHSWNHCAGKDNPADLLTRGINAELLVNNSKWWTGGEFLQKVDMNSLDSENEVDMNTVSNELRRNIPENLRVMTTTLNEQMGFIDNLLRVTNNYSKLVRICAYIFRFSCNSRNPKCKLVGPVTVEERNQAEVKLIKSVQNIEFVKDIQALKVNSCVGSKSKLKSLLPFLDSNDVLRVGGRLKNASIKDDKKFPIILSSKSVLTYLILRHYHTMYLHINPTSLLNIVRLRFWPLNGRNLVRKVFHDCVKCTRAKPFTLEKVMSSLPPERVTKDFPFNVSGVDFCGPFLIKYPGQRKGDFRKVYIAVFVCFVTKAVHLEMVGDLTADAFIACLKRFFSRRGKSAVLYSDNATNFVGACRELKRLHYLVQNPDQKITSYLTNEQIVWKFSPPSSPHFGGLWEAGVKSCKYYLKRNVGNNKLTYEEFLTLINQVEGLLNSRPLTPLPAENNEFQVLTPAHFLLGREIHSIEEPSLLDVNESRLDKWQKLNKYVQSIWKRWQLDYLNTLQQRNKWKLEKNDVKLGSIVLIKEDNLPPSKWALGKLIKLIASKDGHIRVVKIKTQGGEFTRPITKICVLPVEI